MTRYLPLLLLPLLLAACTQPPKEYDWDSGGDNSRDRAKAFFVGQNVSERISDPEGDHTDWKVVRIREQGTLSVTIAVDNTRSMDGFVSLKDGYGVELDRKPLNASDVLYTFDKIPVYQGEYYIELKIETGSSPYTVGATFEPLKKNDPIFVAVDPDPPTGGGGGRRPKDPPTSSTAPPTSVASAPPVTTPEAPPDNPPPTGDNTVTLKGYIVRIAPREEGGALLTITGLGSADGVKGGMSGTILGLNAPFQVTAVAPRAAYAVTKADAEDVKLHKNVTLTLKR